MATRERPEMRQVYFIEAEGRDLVKIGSADDAVKRLATLQVGSPDRLVLLGVHHVDDAVAWERGLHQNFAEYRVRGEWFRKVDRLAEYVVECVFRIEEHHIQYILRPQPYVEPLVSFTPQPGESMRAMMRRLRVRMDELGIPA